MKQVQQEIPVNGSLPGFPFRECPEVPRWPDRPFTTLQSGTQGPPPC